MENKKNFYIEGKWQEPQSTQEIKVINPATEENIAVITVGTVSYTHLTLPTIYSV